MADIRYDNERDRLAHGFDAGTIVDGTVVFDESRGRFVLVDEDGIGFDPQAALEALKGKKVRMTMVSFEALIELEDMLQVAQGAAPVLVEVPDAPDGKSG